MDRELPSDEAIVARVRARDPGALDEVYQRYSRAVHSLAFRVLRDSAVAEDVTQEVFLKLWRQPESYNPERGALGSWLLSVAHNRAIDVLRRRKVREEHPLPESHETADIIADGAIDPSELASLQESADAVRRALTKIPANQREAIEMAFFQGKTHAEISAELGEPLGTAKTRIRLGMRKLRSLLEEEGVVGRA
jgi:RNA polymerase sigma-70 factor (ECF subfamily)